MDVGGGAPFGSSSDAAAGGSTVKLSAALLATEVARSDSETMRVSSPRAMRGGGRRAAGLAAAPSSRRGVCGCCCGAERTLRSADEWADGDTFCDWFESALDCGEGSWLDFVTKPELRRTALIGIGVAMLQQLVGTNAILYYGASLLPAARLNNGTAMSADSDPGWRGGGVDAAWNAVGGDGNSTLPSGSKPPQLIVLGIVGVVNVVGTIVPLMLIDRVGRRILLLVGSALMSVSFLSVGVLLNVFGQTVLDVDADHDSSTVVSRPLLCFARPAALPSPIHPALLTPKLLGIFMHALRHNSTGSRSECPRIHRRGPHRLHLLLLRVVGCWRVGSLRRALSNAVPSTRRDTNHARELDLQHGDRSNHIQGDLQQKNDALS